MRDTRTERAGMPVTMQDVPTTERARDRSGQPAYTRLQVLGLLLIAGTVLAITAVITVTEPRLAGEVLAFFGPVAAVTVLAAWLAWRYGAWARVVGVLVGLVAAVLLSWSAVALTHPESVVDFGLGLGVTAGVVLTLGGGIAALVSGRRGRYVTEPTGVERGLVRGVGAVLGVALTASAVLTLAGRGTVDPAEAVGAMPVEMAGFEFRPSEIRLDGPDARLVVHNADAFLHDISIPALEAGAVRVTPGSTVVVEVTGAAAGTYVLYCTLHSDLSVDQPGDEDMTALLVVQ
jgi:plastocyanin